MSKSPAVSDAPAGSSRGRRRIAKILEAAKAEFLKHGYHATSIDAILKHAGGSKSTLYGDFPSKAALFRAVAQSIVSTGIEPKLDPDKDIRETLLKFAEYRMQIVSSPANIALVHLVLSEQKRFPDIATTYWEEGPQRRQDALCAYFSALAERDALRVDDAHAAANQFVALLTQPWYMRQLCMPWTAPSAQARKKHAKETVELFLRLCEYRPQRRGSSSAYVR